MPLRRRSRSAELARHQCHGFAAAARLPTLVRSPVLSHGGARPRCSIEVRSIEPERPRAVRRLLQPNRFASTTMDDPNPAHRVGSRPPSQLRSRVAVAEMPLSRHSARGQPRLHGPGVERWANRPIDSTPPGAIARAGSFAPPRWARTPRVADSLRRGLELLPRRRALRCRRPCESAKTARARTFRPSGPASRSSREGCPGPHSAKNEVSVHSPRCFPSPEDP